MRIGLILSNDWEVFGDGSGDYFQVQHEPLEQCLEITKKHGAFMTVFAEVGQQLWGFRSRAEEDSHSAKVAEAWEEILKKTLEYGGDVQLHLHPQWTDSTYADGRWDLNYDRWAIGRMKKEDVREVLKRGKEYLESLLREAKPDYSCHSFRAGAYCIQPSGTVLDVLRELDFRSDTSVTKGYFDASFYDYRDAFSNFLPWTIGNDVRYAAKSAQRDQILEFPIYSFSMVDSMGLRATLGNDRAKNLAYKMNFGVPYREEDKAWFKERDRIRAERYPAANRPMQQSTSHKLKGLLASKEGILSIAAWPTKVQLDYDYLPANVFVKGIEKVKDQKWWRKHQDSDLIIPIMASGHVKNMHNADNLDRILTLARETFGDQLVFWTPDDAVKYWSKEEHLQQVMN